MMASARRLMAVVGIGLLVLLLAGCSEETPLTAYRVERFRGL